MPEAFIRLRGHTAQLAVMMHDDRTELPLNTVSDCLVKVILNTS